MSTQRVPAGARWSVLGLFCLLAGSCGGDPSSPDPGIDSLFDLFGPSLYRADGSSVGVETLDGVAVIGIYFASRGCPACQSFTPKLLELYHAVQQAGGSLEVVYVSADASASIMFEYMTSAGMPWLALPWRGSYANALFHLYGVQWIPTVVVVDGTGRTLSTTGRDEVERQGAGAYEEWLARASTR